MFKVRYGLPANKRIRVVADLYASPTEMRPMRLLQFRGQFSSRSLDMLFRLLVGDNSKLAG